MPLGLVYIATALRAKGHDASILDLNTCREIDDLGFLKVVQTENPDYVGIASTSPTHLDACHLAKLVKSVCDVPVIKGGTHETYCFETSLRLHPEIDISVIGPAEATMSDLIQALEAGAELSSVAGIAFRQDDQIIVTQKRVLENNLDAYLHPDRRFLTPSSFYDFDIFGGARTTQVRMSRGCSFGCTFCPVDRTYKFHTADYVLKELDDVADQGFQAIFWDDSIFTFKKSLLQAVLNGMIGKNLKFKMGAQTRSDVNTDRETLELMKVAGFTYLSLGLESGDEAILKEYNKRLTVQSVRNAVRYCKELGIRTSITTILGAPNETLNAVERTVDVINEIGPDAVSWSVCSYYPGSFLEFDPMWYEDPDLSRDPYWKVFDEGYKSKHVRDESYIRSAYDVVLRKINPEIKI